MTNPYTAPPAASARTAPGWARKRYVLPALAVALFIGAGIGNSGGNTTESAAAKPGPTTTVTATTTATATRTATETVTATPAETVTVRSTKTVRATVTAQAAGAGGAGSGGGSVYYENCAAARAAGAAPVHVGDPGYGRHLDRDGDGVGCE
ncbi:excalibur calcium-binding domain-containing protein [Streptomyces sp. S1A1-7]|uniref:excalibur calcium-binding domain-containing protein n=1 Tax=Streptomyces sp. S1A1-7 TaxID=2594459 RepID=UPI0011653588|nr:excalibur calcium-binding domain-containing protein [Streptomyces sp. S1A1-7]QDN76324.1 excalibur calcium-binding domain-containing protein [Streptomyces sp. S1A1-7]